jgi:hypothetical protein
MVHKALNFKDKTKIGKVFNEKLVNYQTVKLSD